MAEEEKIEEQEGAEGAEGEAGAEGGKKGGNKLLIIIAAAVVVLVGAGGGAFFMLSGSGSEEEAVVVEEPAEEPVVVEEVVYYELPEILVNLSSISGANRFLKIKVNLELKSEQEKLMVEKVLPRIIDDYQLYLRQLRVEDLTGAKGIQRLKEALLIRANQAAQPLEIRAVLFKEILVQ